MLQKLILYTLIIIVIINCAIFADNLSNDKPDINKRILKTETSLISPNLGPDLLNLEKNKVKSRSSILDNMKKNKIPGVTIAVVNDFKIEWTKTYGEVRVGTGNKPTDDTYFEAGSTTKLLTAVLVLQLVETGKLSLDIDVNNYLKSWKIPENNFTKDKKVTLRYLLSHQSGFCNTPGGFTQKDDKTPSIVDVLNGQLPAINVKAEIEHIPGTKWQYSNFNYIIIQLLLEDHFGDSYENLMQKNIFKPLKMTRSRFSQPTDLKSKNEIIVPHDKKGIAHDRPLHTSIKAHGELLTTPTDLARFSIELLRAYMNHPTKVISNKTARKILKIERRLKPKELYGLTGFGLGAMIFGEKDSFYFLHPGSNMPGTNCWLIANPKTGQGFVGMTNGAMGELLLLEIIGAVSVEYEWPTP